MTVLGKTKFCGTKGTNPRQKSFIAIQLNMDIFQAIVARKSSRSYLKKIVEEEKINAIVKAGNMASVSAKLFITVITNQEVLKEIALETKKMFLESGSEALVARAKNPTFNALYGAPVLILLTVEKTSQLSVDRNNVASAGCAAENMMLTATALGLGSCYMYAPVPAFSNPEIRKKVGIASDQDALCTVIVGYSADLSPHPPRKPAVNVRYCK